MSLLGPYVLAALLVGIGVYGALARRNAVLMLVGVELILGGAKLVEQVAAALRLSPKTLDVRGHHSRDEKPDDAAEQLGQADVDPVERPHSHVTEADLDQHGEDDRIDHGGPDAEERESVPVGAENCEAEAIVDPQCRDQERD